MHQLSYGVYLDRVLAGWVGKSIGGVIGAPFECHKQFNSVPIDKLWPGKLWPNDDLDIQVVWLEALQEIGLDPSSLELAKFWQERCFYVCCEYGVFIDNLEHGVNPPRSGLWNNGWFQESEGCPIRSELWGFIAPGNPKLAAGYASKDGCLDHGEVSIGIEEFLSAAAAMSFFSDSIVELMESTCALFPEDNSAVKIWREVREICREYPDCHDAWLALVRRCGHRDSTRAPINTAFAFMALILGGDDFRKIMQCCIQSGWDCDCTAATAGALFGAVHGLQAIPEEYRSKLGKNLVCAVEIKHQFQPLADFAAETCALGIELAAVKNSSVRIEGAPEVKIRPLRSPAVSISAEYPETPELFRKKPTRIELTVSNPTAKAVSGELKIALPEHVLLETEDIRQGLLAPDTSRQDSKSPAPCTKKSIHGKRLSIAPHASERVMLSVRSGSEILADKNLFQASFGGAELEFGLFGTKHWRVYGPYWDMWDKEKNAVCPYQNDTCTCNPGNLPEFASDAMNTHVRFNHEYLDEARLLREPIPEEKPTEIERAERSFSARDLDGFQGTCCRYLETTVCGLEPDDISLRVNTDCAFRCWFDGQAVLEKDSADTFEMGSGTFHVTGKPQRLVLKIVTTLENFHAEFSLWKVTDTRKRAVSPHYPHVKWL